MYKLRCPECKKTDRFQVEQQHDTARAECGWCEYVWYPRCLQPTKRAWKRGYKVVTRHGSGQLTSFFSGTKDTVLYHKGIVARPNEGYGKLSVFDSFEHANTFRLQHSYREKLEGQSHEIWLCDYMGEAIAGAKSIPIGTIRTSAVRLIERRYPAPPSVPPNVVIYRGWKVVARCGNGERVSFVMSDDQEVTYEKDVWSRILMFVGRFGFVIMRRQGVLHRRVLKAPSEHQPCDSSNASFRAPLGMVKILTRCDKGDQL